VLRILADFGFSFGSQRGSHVKVQRVVPGGARQTLTVPLHRELDRGTLTAIYRQALRFIPEDNQLPAALAGWIESQGGGARHVRDVGLQADAEVHTLTEALPTEFTR
jgi:predicted RNA binding protein YcfA (HicA-like mRNA interferase family)